MRLIDVDELKEALDKVQYTQEFCIEHQIDYSISMQMLGLVINNAPTVESEVIKEWHGSTKSASCLVCNLCGMSVNYMQVEEGYMLNFCPNCGAGMRGEKKMKNCSDCKYRGYLGIETKTDNNGYEIKTKYCGLRCTNPGCIFFRSPAEPLIKAGLDNCTGYEVIENG